MFSFVIYEAVERTIKRNGNDSFIEEMQTNVMHKEKNNRKVLFRENTAMD